MTAAGAALAGRALAASLQQDACTIVRPSSAAPTINDATGALTYPAGTTIYTGPCRVRSEPAARAMRVEAQERRIAIRTYLVSVPRSPSDHRWALNAIKHLRRMGYE